MSEQENNQGDFAKIKSFIGEQTRVADDLIETRFNNNGTFRVTIASENKEPARIIEIASKLGAINSQYSAEKKQIILDFKNDKILLEQAGKASQPVRPNQAEKTSPIVEEVTLQEKLTQPVRGYIPCS